MISRRDRVRLLLGTYLDAFHPETGDGAHVGTPESRPLQHGELWKRGSYADVEKALDALRLLGRRESGKRWRLRYGWLWRRYVEDPGGKRHYEPHERAHADHGLDAATKLMPENIYVPLEVSHNAGIINEARSATRPGDRYKRAA